jgi:ubiquinone/menaquinone biosynthesis C-methylase UbiE
MPDPDWWEALWPQPAAVIGALGIEPGIDVVDLCCGDGLFTLPLARVARRVVAIDLDPTMLERARARLVAAGVTNCRLVAGDAYSVAELVPEPVDAVFIANTFHGVPDKSRLAHAVAEVLRLRGRFIIVNWHRRAREETTVLGQSRGPKTEMRMAPADVSAAVAPAGFGVLRVIELPPYHYGAIFEKAIVTSP